MRNDYSVYDNSEYEYITCPCCAGTGMDNYSLDHKCYTCKGVGRIEVKKDEKEDILRRHGF